MPDKGGQVTVVYAEVNGVREPYINGKDLVTWLQEIETGCSKIKEDGKDISNEALVMIAIIRENIESFCVEK